MNTSAQVSLPLLVAMLLVAGLAGAQKGEFDFAPETIEKSGPPSETLKTARDLYAEADYFAASTKLHAVIEGKTKDGPANRQQAEFWMGKTLYHLGFYSASLAYFDRVVQKGDAHRYYGETLKWLASLSQKLPESAGILEKIGGYERSYLQQSVLDSVRGELLYLLGRFHYHKGDIDQAIELFSSVPRDSPAFARAKFMEGITHVRAFRATPAADALKDLLRTAREAPATHEISEFAQLAELSLARVFYSTKQFDLSIKYYEKIPIESPEWLASLFESSWAHFMRNNFSQALGNIHTLNAPFFEDQFFPESLILKAVILWKNCLYDQAQAAVEQFKARYPAFKRDVDGFIEKYSDPAELYQRVLKMREGETELSEPVARLVLSVLADKQLARAVEFVAEVEREMQELEAADEEWKAAPVAAMILQDLSLQKSLAENAAGELVQRRLQRLAKEINSLEQQSLDVQYENIRGKKGQLEAKRREEQVVAVAGEPSTVTVDDQHQLWPFNGEYWRDELGYYRFKIASKCTR